MTAGGAQEHRQKEFLASQEQLGCDECRQKHSSPARRAEQRRHEDAVQREVSRVQFTPDPTLNQAIGRQHHQGRRERRRHRRVTPTPLPQPPPHSSRPRAAVQVPRPEGERPARGAGQDDDVFPEARRAKAGDGPRSMRDCAISPRCSRSS